MERSNKNTRTKMQWNFHYAQYKGQAIGRGVVETRGRGRNPGSKPRVETRVETLRCPVFLMKDSQTELDHQRQTAGVCMLVGG
jgi:hypothetical protein